MKRCSKCKQEKSSDSFHKNANYCKLCKKQYDDEHKEHLKLIRKNNHIKNRDRDNIRNKNYYKSSYKDAMKSTYEKIYYSTMNHIYLKKLLAKCLNRAKQLSVEFDLDEEFLTQLYQQQSGKCAVTGLDFVFDKTIDFSKRPFVPSIDRITNNLGYTKNNVRFVCAAVNLAINEFGDAIFDQICEAYILRKQNI